MTAKGKTTKAHDEKIARMVFSSIYPNYLNKVLKKGRSEKELQEVILQAMLQERVTCAKMAPQSTTP
jgi:hypothetical protein